MTAETIITALAGQRGMALCPAHDDHNPSLSVAEKDGKLLVKCFAGCEQSAVIDALREKGLWPEGERQEQKREIVCTYSYTDEHGELLYEIVRYDPKDFRQRFPDGRGGWVWKKHPRQVLYHLPEVLEAPIVFLVEGEKDCETLREYGFVATTNAGGSNAPWLDLFTKTLAGREVIIIPDNDKPGRDWCVRLVRALTGHVAKLIVLTLDDPKCKDVSDWFAAGHNETELIYMLDGDGVTR